MAATRSARHARSVLLDFSRGVVGGVSDFGRKVRHVRLCDNMFMRPAGALRVRGGSQRITSAFLPAKGHSLGEWLASNGANKMFVGTDTTPFLYELTATTLTAQTTPTMAGGILTFAQLNDVLWMTEYGGAEKPMFFAATNPANTWLTAVLPKPGAAPTFGADQAGGALTPTTDYFYRVRWRYANGSSLAGTVSAAQQVVAASGNYTIRLATLPVPGAPRSDYLGWTLERTKQGGSSAGPFYLVTDGTAATYDDGAADADLYSRTDELVHAEPPHVDGIIAHKERLFGWAGSTVYASQAIGDSEATGIANWPALLGYTFGKDDGDVIQFCVSQQDRLVVVKRQSVWALEGDDPDSFRVVPLFKGAGAAGPRCGAGIGGTLWFYGSSGAASPVSGLHRMDGNSIKPVGWIEVGHYFDQFVPGNIAEVELVQYQGQYMMVAYAHNATYNDEHVVYDQRFDNWTHFTNWRMRGHIIQRGAQFGGATLIFCDPRNWPAFSKAGVTAGMTVTGAGIPAATTVSSVGTNGDSIELSNAATATAGPVTLTFGGSIAIVTCYTTNTSKTVTSKDYPIWQGFRGFKDEKLSNGTGGIPVGIAIETPFVDDGMPDVFKDFERLEVYGNGDNELLSVTLSFDPIVPSAILSVALANSGLIWGAFLWGASAWGSLNEGTGTTGLPEGRIARRYKARVTGNISGDMLFKGLIVDYSIEPERRYS